MKQKLLVSTLSLLFVFMCNAQRKGGYNFEEFTPKDLAKWESYGLGAIEENHGQTVMHETTGSLGYMLVSPDTYGENVIVSYDIMTLNPATVMIVEMAAHNSDNFDLKLDADYDGNVKYLFKNVNMYMFAFHNAAHNKPGPFVRKYPKPGGKPLIQSKKNVLEVGKYYHVEIEMRAGIISFRVDGKKIFKVKDETNYKGGKIILRIRGTAPELASCIMKNVKIGSL